MNESNDGSGGIVTALYTITNQQLSKTEKLIKEMIKDVDNGRKKFRKKSTNTTPKKKKRK